jgi:hypothetical protein
MPRLADESPSALPGSTFADAVPDAEAPSLVPVAPGKTEATPRSTTEGNNGAM